MEAVHSIHKLKIHVMRISKSLVGALDIQRHKVEQEIKKELKIMVESRFQGTGLTYCQIGSIKSERDRK